MAFTWNEKRLLAAQLLAEDDLPDHEIAARCGIARSALAKWKAQPEFAARVKELVDAYAERILSHGLARREKRVEVLFDLVERLQGVITDRAEAYATGLCEEPGMERGIMSHTVRTFGAGDKAVTTHEYAVDTPAIKELRGVLQQIATEVGQFTERRAVDLTTNGKDLTFTLEFDRASAPDADL